MGLLQSAIRLYSEVDGVESAMFLIYFVVVKVRVLVTNVFPSTS